MRWLSLWLILSGCGPGPEVDLPSDGAGEREWSYRAIGGISMGAAAVQLGLQRPEDFDVIAGLGGYMDQTYLMTAAQRLWLGGFCPLDELEAHADVLNDPILAPDCGPGEVWDDLEWDQDFNHLHFDTNGLSLNREFYLRVFKMVALGLGNPAMRSTLETPYLPAGIDAGWWASTPAAERCAGGYWLPVDVSINAEYNPEGRYRAIPLCDGDARVTAGLPRGVFDPAADHTLPSDVMLAIDINGNGVRDLAEPILFNDRERFDDVGDDGCADPREDGAGGCLPESAPDGWALDPNGDDWDALANPFGPEGNGIHDPGEPFADLGLDGVADTRDAGEGNGRFDRIGAWDRIDALSPSRILRELDADVLAGIDFYFDAGIRDGLQAGASTRRVFGALVGRGEDARRYQGMTRLPTSLYPDAVDGQVGSFALTEDLSADAVGKHVYVEYGDPDATPEMIEEGDGGHVGTTAQALDRLVNFLDFAIRRFPEPDLAPETNATPRIEVHHYYSEALQNRRYYVIAKPPGYEEAGHADDRYPTVFLLHGLGQEARDMEPVALLSFAPMAQGTLPKALVVYPDGACCDRDRETGERYCACTSEGEVTTCVDPTCTGPEETCGTVTLDRHDLEEECYGGSLYMDLLTNKWGEPRDDLGYGTSILELVDEVDALYRTRSGE